MLTKPAARRALAAVLEAHPNTDEIAIAMIRYSEVALVTVCTYLPPTPGSQLYRLVPVALIDAVPIVHNGRGHVPRKVAMVPNSHAFRAADPLGIDRFVVAQNGSGVRIGAGTQHREVRVSIPDDLEEKADYYMRVMNAAKRLGHGSRLFGGSTLYEPIDA